MQQVFTAPTLNEASRKADTEVELSEGQSFVVAGLLDNRDTENMAKIPFIGSIPILGQLFKSHDVNKTRTDLILIVTPEITEPLNPTVRTPSWPLPNRRAISTSSCIFVTVFRARSLKYSPTFVSRTPRVVR